MHALILAMGFALLPGDDVLVERSLAWLKRAMTSEEWTLDNGQPGNRQAKQHVVEAACAYLLLLYPDLEGYDALREELDRKVTALASRRVAPLSFAHFANWVEGFAALYLFEKAQRGNKNLAVLKTLAAGMEDRQNAQGGWGHGLSMGVPFYPSTLVATTYWALFTLGGCRRFAVDVDDFVLDEALALLEKVQAASGGFPYGGPEYLKGVEAGRTSGVVLALAGLGKTEGPLFSGAVAYLQRNLASIPHGHASPAMHVLAGSLGTCAVSEELWKDYHHAVLVRVAKSQNRDGSFSDVEPGSPDSFGFMGSDLVNTAYRTALYAAALAMPRSRFTSSLRTNGTLVKAENKPSSLPKAKRLWSAPYTGIEAMAFAKNAWLAVMNTGSVLSIAPDDGRTLGGTAISLKDRAVNLNRIVVTEGHFLAWTEPAEDEQFPQSLRELLDAEPRSYSLVCFSLDSGGVAWATEYSGRLEGLGLDASSIYLLDRSGSLKRRSLSLGHLVMEYPGQKMRVNAGLAAFEGGAMAVSIESSIKAYDAFGEQIWETKLRGGRGVTPPSATVLKGRLYVGSTDGSVTRRNVKTGRVEQSVNVGSAVMDLEVLAKERIAVLTWDRRVHGLQGMKEDWVYDSGAGRESAERPRMWHDQRYLWVSEPALKILIALDPETGRAAGEIPLPDGAAWTAWKGEALVAGEKHLSSYAVP